MFDRFRCKGWLRLVGSSKLWVSFAEYRVFYRALLQKRPVILRSLRVEGTRYVAFRCIIDFFRGLGFKVHG